MNNYNFSRGNQLSEQEKMPSGRNLSSLGSEWRNNKDWTGQ